MLFYAILYNQSLKIQEIWYWYKLIYKLHFYIFLIFLQNALNSNIYFFLPQNQDPIQGHLDVVLP